MKSQYDPFRKCYKIDNNRIILGDLNLSIVDLQTKKVQDITEGRGIGDIASDEKRVVALFCPSENIGGKVKIIIWEGQSSREIEIYEISIDTMYLINLKNDILFIGLNKWKEKKSIIQAMDINTGKFLYEKYFNEPLWFYIQDEQIIVEQRLDQILCLDFSPPAIVVRENVQELLLQEIAKENRTKPVPPAPIVILKFAIERMIQKVHSCVMTLFNVISKIFQAIKNLLSRAYHHLKLGRLNSRMTR